MADELAGTILAVRYIYPLLSSSLLELGLHATLSTQYPGSFRPLPPLKAPHTPFVGHPTHILPQVDTPCRGSLAVGRDRGWIDGAGCEGIVYGAGWRGRVVGVGCH